MSYSNYPDAVKNNAKRGLELNEKQGNKCATPVGKKRGADLADGRALSLDTVARLFNYLTRSKVHYNPENTEACGTISYLLWGGPAALRWAGKILKEEGRLEQESFHLAVTVIDGKPAYDTKEEALVIAEAKGCEGYHTHELNGTTYYMPCKTHDEFAEVGPRGGIKKSPKAPKSKTPNPNPKKGKGKGGDASTSRGAKVPKDVEKILQGKSDDFNERYKDKLGYGVTVSKLKAVYKRGVGAFQTSHSPNVTSERQWALARVNAFLYLVKNGRPERKAYTQDNDLLPAKHPKA